MLWMEPTVIMQSNFIDFNWLFESNLRLLKCEASKKNNSGVSEDACNAAKEFIQVVFLAAKFIRLREICAFSFPAEYLVALTLFQH